MLKRLKDKEGGRLPCTINTYGFGYELDSELLSQLAIDGSGAYAFIPDAGFVGTVFVNAMANVLATVAKDATLTLTPENGASFVGDGILGGYPVKKDGQNMILNLGSLQFGQSKDVILQMKMPPGAVSAGYLTASLEYGTRAGTLSTATCKDPGAGSPDSFPLVEQQRLRLRVVDGCRQAMKLTKQSAADKAAGKPVPLPAAQEVAQALISEIEASGVIDEENIQALLQDVTGQVSEALSKEEWYSKWGLHYLPSLMFAHLMQQCNNFKDAGVQVYGGELFQNIRDAADDIFLLLPAPTPSARPPPPAASSGMGGGFGGMASMASPPAAPSAPVNMAAFHDRYAGCIDGASLVQMANGSFQRVAEIRKGDKVAAFGGGEAEVACVVRTRSPGGCFPLVQMPDDGPRLTAYHPVFVSDRWCFPVDIAPVAISECHSVYSFCLQAEGIVERVTSEATPPSTCAVLVQGVPCVCLGHGIQSDNARHPFFGSRRAVEESLAMLPGYESGLIDVGPVLRDPETGLVCGFDVPLDATVARTDVSF